METVRVAGSVTRFKGAPVAVSALLKRLDDGGIEMSILDSALRWDVPAASATILTPFFESSVRRLDVERALESRRTVFNFRYTDGDGVERSATIVLAGRQPVATGSSTFLGPST